MTARKWTVTKTDLKLCEAIEKAASVLPLTAKLLANRGLDTPEKINSFLNIEHIELHDPYLLMDMDKAVARIQTAIDKKERVCIYGDYDVDGVTSTVMLYAYLRDKGLACEYFIPERIAEGYGLSLPVIERLAGKTDLIITVDTGITAVSEVKYAKDCGIDMVITDHHSCRDTIPDAVAVVNPHRDDCGYPFKNLAGAGVVFKLLCALDGSTERICEQYAELAAVGTIADVMPIIDENRRIASMGLKKLANTSSCGMLALMRHSGIIRNGRFVKKVTSSTVGYVLAPRINAAGRIASAEKAVELLATTDEAQADEIAAQLCEINKQRQTTEQAIYEQALEQIKNGDKEDMFYVLASDGWHQGVIGVVASKIAERFSLPGILFSFDGDIAKGSGRSIKGFSLMDALTYCGDLLLEYGGHELAAGLSIQRSKIDEFRNRINEYAKAHIEKTDAAIPLEIECECSFSDLTMRGIEETLRLEPFGLQNPQPVLLLRNVQIVDIVPLTNGKHLKFKVKQPQRAIGGINAVYYGVPTENFLLTEGDICDIVFTADINEYMGSRSPQLIIKALRPAEPEYANIKRFEGLYNAIYKDGDRSPVPTESIPAIADFKAVYRFLKRELAEDKKRFSVSAVCRAVKAIEKIDIDYLKLKIILDVMAQEGLIKRVYSPDGRIFELALLPVTHKVSLDRSELLARIKENHTAMSD